MKKIIAIVLTFVVSMSFFAFTASAEEHYIDLYENFEVDTMLYPGDTVSYFLGTMMGVGAQVKYYGGAFDIYEEQYYGTSAEEYEYFEDLTNTGFEIKDIGGLATGAKIVGDSEVKDPDVAIDYAIEHCVLEGWRVTYCNHGEYGFELTLEAVWAEDAEDPFPEPVVEEPTIIDIILDYLKQATTFLMGILSQVVVKIMDYLGITEIPAIG